MYLVTCGDHGDHGTSVSDEIDQKMKVGKNTWFFLRFFFPAHLDHWKLRYPACVPVYLVTMVTMGPVCLMKLTRKQKLLKTLGFYLALVY